MNGIIAGAKRWRATMTPRDAIGARSGASGARAAGSARPPRLVGSAARRPRPTPGPAGRHRGAGGTSRMRSRLTSTTSCSGWAAPADPSSSTSASVTGTNRDQRVRAASGCDARRPVEVARDANGPISRRTGSAIVRSRRQRVAAPALDLDQGELAPRDLELVHARPCGRPRAPRASRREDEEVELVDLVAEATLAEVDLALRPGSPPPRPPATRALVPSPTSAPEDSGRRHLGGAYAAATRGEAVPFAAVAGRARQGSALSASAATASSAGDDDERRRRRAST